MNVNEAVSLAARIESLIRRADTFGKSREDLLEELSYVARDLRDYADRLDEALYDDYINHTGDIGLTGQPAG
jgi:hypothetical protein